VSDYKHITERDGFILEIMERNDDFISIDKRSYFKKVAIRSSHSKSKRKLFIYRRNHEDTKPEISSGRNRRK
jgi:hypothetical protein